MSIKLKNKPVALVTGASKGIGADIAEVLARAGAKVILIGRDEITLKKKVSFLLRKKYDCDYIISDVTNYKKISSFIDKINRVDILVNNAATIIINKFEKYTEDDFDRICNLNIKSYFMLSQMVVDKMKKSQLDSGVIINISSVMGKVSQPANSPRPQSLYIMSKHAVEGLTKALSAELAPFNIRVNSVCPAYVDTDLTAKLFRDQEIKSYFLNKIPLGKFVEKRDVSNTVLFLCSSMAKMITGESIMVDGGWTAI